MNGTAPPIPMLEIRTLTKRLANGPLYVGENRLELLSVEIEEKRWRLILTLLVLTPDCGQRQNLWLLVSVEFPPVSEAVQFSPALLPADFCGMRPFG